MIENEGTLEEYPIQIPGFGLHAIKAKQRDEEEKARRAKAQHPRFTYEKRINKKFLKGEMRFKEREQEIFTKMEDLLDEEVIR